MRAGRRKREEKKGGRGARRARIKDAMAIYYIYIHTKN
jgi:hypothetical protein